jgi:hypothetical protein
MRCRQILHAFQVFQVYPPTLPKKKKFQRTLRVSVSHLDRLCCVLCVSLIRCMGKIMSTFSFVWGGWVHTHKDHLLIRFGE